MSNKVYYFPLIKNAEEVSASMGEIGVEISTAEVKKTSSAVLRRVLRDARAVLLSGVDSGNSTTLDSEASEAVEREGGHAPGSVEAAAAVLEEMSKSVDMLLRVGVHDAGLQDLMTPDKKRVRLFLSGLINFAKFSRGRSELFFEAMADLRQTVQNANAARGNAERLRQAMARRKKEEEMAQDRATEIAQEMESAEKEITQLNAQQARMREEASQVKAQASRWADEAASDAYRCLQAKEEIGRMRVRLAQSPEQMEAACRKLEAKKAEKQAEMLETKQQMERLQATAKLYERAAAEVATHLSSVEECAAELERSQKLRDDIRQVFDQTGVNESALVQLRDAHHKLREQVQTARAKLHRLETSFAEKVHRVTLAEDEVQSKKAGHMRRTRQIEVATEEKEALAEQTRKEVEEVRAAHQQEVDAAREAYAKLLGSFEEWQRRINQASA